MIAGLLSKLAQLHPDAPGLALAWEALQIARRALDSADEIKAAYREAERRGALEVARAVKAERALAELQGQAPQEGIAAAFRALRAVPRHGATLADLAEAIGVRMGELDDVRRERDALSIRLAIHEQARTVEDPDPRQGKPGPGADLRATDDDAVRLSRAVLSYFTARPGGKCAACESATCAPDCPVPLAREIAERLGAWPIKPRAAVPPPPPAAPPVEGCASKPGPGADLDDMALPEGKTCGDCVQLRRCGWLVSRKGTERTCDWSPSRFAAVPPPPPAAPAPAVNAYDALRPDPSRCPDVRTALELLDAAVNALPEGPAREAVSLARIQWRDGDRAIALALMKAMPRPLGPLPKEVFYAIGRMAADIERDGAAAQKGA